MELTEELRREHELGSAEPLYTVHTIMNEEELRRAIYTTRQRQRTFDCILMAVMAIVCLVQAYVFQTGVGIGGAAMCVLLIIQRLANARQHTDQSIGNLREKFGAAKLETSLYFFEDKIIILRHLYDRCDENAYSCYHKLYLKNDFLYLCNDNNRGEFMRYQDIPEKDALVDFLKSRCPDLWVRK